MRKEVLQIIHQGHRGIVSCKQKARESVFWPNLSKEIDVMVNSCEICQTTQRNNPKEPISIVIYPYDLGRN